jgi:ketosteroid isomerase-like protein
MNLPRLRSQRGPHTDQAGQTETTEDQETDPMNTDHNRATALKLLEGFSKDGLSAARPYLADKFVWWSPRMGEFQDRLEAVHATASAHLKAPMVFTIHGVTAEGDRVAVEATSHGELKSGRIYHNHYHFLILFKNGIIVTVKEYNDSKHAAEVWEGLL